MTRSALLAALIAAAVGSGCAVILAPNAPLGTVENPVRVSGRSGELDYLGRLRCPSGGAPHFHIQYRAPVGPYGNKLDRFSLRCVFDDSDFVVMIDRYHRGYRESRPVGELVLVEPSLSPFFQRPPFAPSSADGP